MRALVLWAAPQHPNLGVAALAAGSEALLQRAFGPDIEVEYHATGGADLPANDGPLNISHALPLLRTRVLRPGTLRDWLRSYDVVLDTRAGDSFADIYSLKRLVKMTQIGLYARQWKVPLVMAPQTIGPFDTRRGRALARLSLRSATTVMTRDARSADAARRLGRAADVVSTDVAFAIPRPERSDTHDVLLNPSGLLWPENSHVDHKAYQDLMRTLVDDLEVQGRRVSLLAHVAAGRDRLADNDVIPVDELAPRISGDVVIPEDLRDVRSAVSGARLVIGARMHACLNALSTGTPAIPLAYSRKFAPLLEQIGWDHTLDLRTGQVRSADICALAGRSDELAGAVTAVNAATDALIEDAAAALRRSV